MDKYFFLLIFLFFFFSCSKKKQLDTRLSTTLFEKIPSGKTNIDFNNQIAEELNNFFQVYNYAYNGAGVAIGDINNDDLPDIYFTGNQVDDKLYINKGDFVFEDITANSGVLNKTSWHNGVVMADVNSDGLLDIYVCKGGWKDSSSQRRNLLYINEGNNKFKESAKSYGLADDGFSMMATFLDVDNDNDLDVYLVNRPQEFFLSIDRYHEIEKNKVSQFVDKLYINESGKFVDRSLEYGISNNLGNGLGISVADLDKNGFMDIYVGNDFYENDYLFKNNGNKKLIENIKKSTNHTSFFTMGVDIVDFNNDGFEDIFTLDMLPNDYVRSKVNMASMNVGKYNQYIKEGFHYQYMHNGLQLNRGDFFFSEVSQLSGIAKTDWSWACLGADFNNNGKNDIYVTNGFKRDIWNKDAHKKYLEYTNKGVDKSKSKDQIIKDLVSFYPSVKLSNFLFHNNGDLTFTNKSKEWGLDTPSFSNGAAYADLDNDGDLDIVVNNIDDKAFVYKNNSDLYKDTNYLKIKLKGPKQNSFGLGAKITLFHKDSIQYKDFKTVKGYLSSVEPIVHFGLSDLRKIDSIHVKWLDNRLNRIYDVFTNRTIHVNYKDSKKVNSKKASFKSLLVNATKTSFLKNIIHKENEYDDYNDQILLPHKMSTLGPALAVGDVNGDGLEDFFIGGSKGYESQLWLQKKDATFYLEQSPVFTKDKEKEDVYAHFFDFDNDKDLDLYVVSGGNEWEKNSDKYSDRLYINNNGVYVKSKNILPQITSSGSVVQSLDFDNDGDLDLFIGGRHIPKEYPKPPKSYLLENIGGEFKDVTDEKGNAFNELGMVTSVAITDIDKDGNKELLVSGEWMPIKIFSWKKSKFIDISKNKGLDNTSGWWNTITPSDIDNDGDIDFVLGNLGLNYKFKASSDKPFYVYAKDYDNNGTQDVFLAKNVEGKIVPIRGKECSTQQLPGLAKKFKTYQEFANADLIDILGDENHKNEVKYKVDMFESILLLNENGAFSIKNLSNEAQFSTVNGVVIEDFNEDGNKDILFAGNRFNVEIETTRSDASIGSLMLGDGNGNFTPLNSVESGFFESDNVKHLKKINVGGKEGVLVAVNNGRMKLYSKRE